jgi:hypothetical protein
MCVSAAPAQAIVGQGGAPAPHAAVVAATGGFSASRWGNPTADAVSKGANGTYQAKQDPGSLFTVDKAIGARKLWSHADRCVRPGSR